MLSGRLDSFELDEVLRFVTAAAVTGRLDVVRTRVAGMLLLDRGLVVNASRGETLTDDPDEALAAAADLFHGTGGAFVLSRIVDPPPAVFHLDIDAFNAEMSRRVTARAAADLLRDLADGRTRSSSAERPSGFAPLHLDGPPVRVLTREEQRMRLRL